jgi:hypothetical protein
MGDGALLHLTPVRYHPSMNRLAALLLALLITCPALAGDPPAKAAIERTLETMSQAALTGDRDAFMACLDTSNAFFKQEQTAWCDDMVKHHPKEVAFALADDPAPIFGDEETHATISIKYTSEVGAAATENGAKGKWPALFIRKNDKWLYAGEDWLKKDGDNFVVLYLKGSEKAADMVLEAFPKARAHDDEGFGVHTGPQQIKLFQSMGHLKATVYLNQPDPALFGWNEHDESIKFMDSYARDVRGWTAAFAHEYGHVCTWEYGKKIKDAPWWVSEGVAELAAEEFLPGSREHLDKEVRAMAKAGTTVPWDDIADYDKAAQPVKMMAYHQGHHMLGYISERWGRDGRRNWLKAMGQGKSLDQATRDVLGLSFEDLDKAWHKALTEPEDKKPEPETDHISALKAEVAVAAQGMTTASVTGDPDAYLTHVYRADKEFLKEQTYFANDLKRKPAQECRIDIGDLEAGDGTIEGPMTWVWKMPPDKDAAGEPKPKKERSVTFKARWIKSDNGGGWLYAGETWERHAAPGVIVYCDPGLDELATRTTQAFTDIRGHVETGFELEDKALPKKTQKIKLYSSMRHLQQSICLSYEDSLGGWNEPGESIKILINPRSRNYDPRHVLLHEYGHVATFELGPKANDAPWWVLEGVADLSAEGDSGRGATRTVETWSKRGQLADWNDLADFHNFRPELGGHVYVQGHHMLGYISDRWGRSGRNKWLTAMAQGKTIDQATQDAFGLSFAKLDEEWRATLPKPEPKEEKKDEPAATSK